MKRWFVLLMTVVLVASMGAAALADDDGAEDEGSEPTELNDKQLQRAEALAAYFAPKLAGGGDDGTSEDATEDADAASAALAEQIVELRTGEPSTGWGALYKLIVIAEYLEEPDLEKVAAELREDGGWGFGKAMKEIREDAEWQESSDTPKNLGQFKKQQREAKGEKKSGDG